MDWDKIVDWADEVARDPPRRTRVALTMIGVGLAVLGVFHHSIYNAFEGPFPLDITQLARMDQVPFRSYVSLRRGDKEVKSYELTDAGVFEQTFHGGGYSTYGASFKWLPVGDRTVLVRAGSGAHHNGPVEGMLRVVENPGGHLSLARAAHLMVDEDDDPLMWALAAAAVGILLVGVGLDQLRRARQKPVRYEI